MAQAACTVGLLALLLTHCQVTVEQLSDPTHAPFPLVFEDNGRSTELTICRTTNRVPTE